MKKYHLLGFLFLLVSTAGTMPGSAFAAEINDNDGDGVPNNIDRCPHLLEDYDGDRDLDGCPDP